MDAVRDMPARFLEMQPHGLGVDAGQHESRSDIPRRAEGAEKIGVGVSGVDQADGTGSFRSPCARAGAFLSDAGFVLKPQLQCLAGMRRLDVL